MFLEWEWVTLGGGLFSNFYSDFECLVLWVFCFFWGNLCVFEIFKNVFWNENRWLWWVYLVTFIHILNFWFLSFLVILVIWSNFWVFEIFENVFWNENGWLWGGVYLVKFIHLRAFYLIFEDGNGHTDRQTDGQTDGRMDGWSENFPILWDFVPHWGRCPATAQLQLENTLKQGKGTSDHIMPLGNGLFFNFT